MTIQKQEGQVLDIIVHVYNNSTVAGTAYIRCSLVPVGQTLGWDLPIAGDTPLEAPVTINPGQTAFPTFRMTIPSGAAAGMYKTVAIARDSTGTTGAVFDTFTKDNSVEITVIVQPFTVDITETEES